MNAPDGGVGGWFASFFFMAFVLALVLAWLVQRCRPPVVVILVWAALGLATIAATLSTLHLLWQTPQLTQPATSHTTPKQTPPPLP